MSDATDMTDAQRAAAVKIEKLLRLGKSPNPAEAALAMEKAQQIALLNNLSMAQVQAAGGEDGRRQDAKQRGGHYRYQQDLWRAVAELNFCLCMVTAVWVQWPKPRGRGVAVADKRTHGWQKQLRLVGKQVNVAATKVMCEYLLQAVDRMCTEQLHGRGEGWAQFYSRWAVSFREGVVGRIVERLEAQREAAVLSEERKQERAAAAAAMAGVSTATALTITDVKQQEADLNKDFMRGLQPGTTARRRADDAAREAKREAEYTAWAAANPEEARRKEAEAAEETRKYWARYRGGGGGERERGKDWSAYKAGYGAGDKLSLHRQAGERPVAGRIG